MKKKNHNMVRRIILIASVLALLMAGCIGYIGYNHIQKAYYSSFEEGLHAAAILLESELSNQFDGDWSLSEDGQLLKGDIAVHDIYQSQLDSLHNATEMNYTIYYGNVRYITTITDPDTGMRMEGSTAPDDVISEVLYRGKEYLVTNADFADQTWYAYYVPLKNSNGNVVGMVFAGRDTSLVASNMAAAARAIAGTFLGFFLFNLVVARLLVSTSSRSIRDIISGLKNLEDGDLNFYIDDRTFNRKDELGVIAESSAMVRDKLQDVISATKKLSDDVTLSGEKLATSAESASNVADQITAAVEDISRGAASQAESMESSVTNTNKMGDSIDEITEKIEDLSNSANDMMTGAQRTVETLNNLMDKNVNVMASMNDIHAQISTTNNSVKSIAEASNMITEIAEQTHLLSLNASIEAARAGEYGKGFSVVATEIGNLSQQSKDAAVSIKEIVENLVTESQKNVEVIEELGKSMQEQNTQLNTTKNDMDAVVENVNNVDNSTKVISKKIHLLNELKAGFSDIITELSAISQQNAASTEETNASMEELNATFSLISNAANDLRDMAETLNEKMSFFTLEEMPS